MKEKEKCCVFCVSWTLFVLFCVHRRRLTLGTHLSRTIQEEEHEEEGKEADDEEEVGGG